MHHRRLEFVAPAVLVVVCLTLYFSVFIRPGLVDLEFVGLMASFDFHSYFVPRFQFGSESILHGQLPTWNPYEYGGIPFLATAQPAVFYPPKVLLYGLLPLEEAHWAFLILHYGLLAGGFLFFLYDRGFRGVPAFVGTALWTFATPLLGSNYHPIRIANLVWMPIAFLLADRAARGNVRALGALALVVAIQISAGYPEVPLDLGFLLGLHAIACWAFREWERPPWKTVPLIALAFALGAVAAAAQLLPLAELGTVARRSAVAAGADDFAKLVAVLPKPAFPLIPGLFVFVAIGALTRRGRVPLVGFAVCGLIAWGGGWRLLQVLPGFSMVRFPFTWSFLIVLHAAWLGAIGCDAVLSQDALGPRARRAAAFAVALSGLVLAALSAVSLAYRADRQLPWSLNLGAPFAAGLSLAAGVALVALVVLGRRRTVTPAAFVVAGYLVIAHLAAYPFGLPSSPFKRPSPKGEIASFVAPLKVQGRAFSSHDIRYGYEITDRVPSLLGVEVSYVPWRYKRIAARLGFVSMFEHVDWPAFAAASGFLDAMNVEFVSAPSGVTPAFIKGGFLFARRNGIFSLFENPDRMGHAWVNYAVRTVKSDEEALNYVLGPDFDPHREVVLEERTRHEYPRTTPVPSTPALMELRGSGFIELSVELARPGVLVVSESAYPGWEATLDGRPTKWFTVNYVLRGVELDAGKHRVRFEYRPASIRWGLVLSAAGLFAIAALLVWRKRSARELRAS